MGCFAFGGHTFVGAVNTRLTPRLHVVGREPLTRYHQRYWVKIANVTAASRINSAVIVSTNK